MLWSYQLAPFITRDIPNSPRINLDSLRQAKQDFRSSISRCPIVPREKGNINPGEIINETLSLVFSIIVLIVMKSRSKAEVGNDDIVILGSPE
jgi:hypothetical protein